MKAPAYRLLVVAHPDDEAIFFAGPLQGLRDLPWSVVCLTDGNADGRGAERHEEFLASTRLFRAKQATHWNYPDRFASRLPVDEIAARLRALPKPKEIYTHGPLGEYGHAHHQDCSLAVHRAFPNARILSPAWNCEADFAHKLTKTQFAKKTEAYIGIYAKETMRFQTILPCMATEPFRRFTTREVEALVGFFRRERELDQKALRDYRWMADELPALRDRLATRLF